MNTNIFVPKKINVGFQNRKDTYSGKLAYVIYFDEKGKLRKETSWNSWRDENIPNEIYDNEPTEGFVLNKKVGGVEECWGWDPRKTYTRVYDPRGFEFEITIPNLLWILENANCIKGKGLEGEFVYGWDGKELLLVPIDSADYKEIERKNKIFHSNDFIKAKDLKVGATYLSKTDGTFVYMGKFENYDNGYWKNGIFFETRKKMIKYCEENNIPKDKTGTGWYSRYYYLEDKYAYGPVGKKHCFYYTYKDYKGNEVGTFIWKSSISKWLINVVDDKCHDNYSEYFDLLESRPDYSMPDYSKSTYNTELLEDFSKRAKNESSHWPYNTIYFYSSANGKIERFKIVPKDCRINKYVLYKCHSSNNNAEMEVIDIFPTETIDEKPYYSSLSRTVTHMIPVTFEEIYEKMKPMYKQDYLSNGKKYTKGH